MNSRAYDGKFTVVPLLLILGIVFYIPVPGQAQITDQSIEIAVMRELKQDDGVRAHNIDVSVDNGIVTLEGNVSTLLEKERSVRLAETIRGVVSVINNMTVTPVKRADREVMGDIEAALILDPATEGLDVGVKVEGGNVTLTGIVESIAEQKIAAQRARNVRGVTNVNNELVIQEKMERPDNELQEEIRRRFEEYVWLDAREISIRVENGVVTLTGSVGSAYERRKAFMLSWINGVKEINYQDLTVDPRQRERLERRTEYVGMDDEQIGAAVERALHHDVRVDATDIRVEVLNGEVELYGTVDNMLSREKAEQNARNTVGVLRVKNYLRVRQNAPVRDPQISERVDEILTTDPLVTKEGMTVSVIKGIVFLDGRVESDFLKDYTADILKPVPGIIDIRNNLIVDSEMEQKNDRMIAEDIRDELFWSIFVDSDDINVQVDEGRAVLSGTVDSPYEARTAVENAYEGGALAVESRLKVDLGERLDDYIDTGYELPDPSGPYH